MKAVRFVASLSVPAGACNASRVCDYPLNNPFATNLSGSRTSVSNDGEPCCVSMPGLFLVDTWNRGSGQNTVIPPPVVGYCPPIPSDIIIVGTPTPQGTILPPERMYLVNANPDYEAFGWLDNEGGLVPSWIGQCGAPEEFYTRYTLAFANDTDHTEGIPVLASSDPRLPDAALLKAAELIAEQVRQLDVRMASLGIVGARQSLVSHRLRYAIFADAERRNDTCAMCMDMYPSFDCHDHVDSRGGRDASLHPEIPYCVEGTKYPTVFSEQFGLPYLDSDGALNPAYCGSTTLLHEFFHSIQDIVIFPRDPVGAQLMQRGAKRAVEEGIYIHHPGIPDDGCDTDFMGCVSMEYHVKAYMTWLGYPAYPEFKFQSRAEIKEKAPWIAVTVYRYVMDSDWNPALGARIDSPRDQTFPPSDTCATAPGSALCGEPLSRDFMGPPMEELLLDPSWVARARLGVPGEEQLWAGLHAVI